MAALTPGTPRPRRVVLIADDGAEERMMLELHFDRRGFDVVLADNGRDALDAVITHRPDVVVSDMNMPYLDGLALCRAVRALPASQGVPVIVWSGVEAMDPRLVEAIALGGVTFLSKALPLSGFDAVLRQVLCTDEVDIAS